MRLMLLILLRTYGGWISLNPDRVILISVTDAYK